MVCFSVIVRIDWYTYCGLLLQRFFESGTTIYAYKYMHLKVEYDMNMHIGQQRGQTVGF